MRFFIAHDSNLQNIVGRFGGEEFILILKNATLQQMIEIPERCQRSIEIKAINLKDEKILRITASFGIALSQSYLAKTQVTRLADEALYLAKKEGRNRLCINDQ